MTSGIVLVDYDPDWPEQFELEARHIRAVMGDSALRIDHVGSTSVPGLKAKPIIDIQITVAAPQPVAPHHKLLNQIGYQHLVIEPLDTTYPFFYKPQLWPASHHIHLCAPGSVEERNHLLFRTFLSDHPEAAAEYATLKQTLADRYGGATQQARECYSMAKSEFVNSVLCRASTNGYQV